MFGVAVIALVWFASTFKVQSWNWDFVLCTSIGLDMAGYVRW